MIYRCYAISVVLITSFLFSLNSLAIDLDPIESNQYLINSLNANLLERFNYESIIFNQSHHIPYGSFVLKDIDKFSTIDTLGMKSQFILRKGDYTFRDLMISTYKINNQDVHFRYMGLVRSYDPTAISNLLGQNFLQNHMLSITKKIEDRSSISSQILYFSENPEVPISYYWDSNDFNKSYYHTRESNSVLWGVKLTHQINDYVNFSYQNSNHYSKLIQYQNDTGNSNSSTQYKYIDDIYYSGFQNAYLDYIYNKILFFSSLSFNQEESAMSSYSVNNIKTLDFKAGFKVNLGKGLLKLSLSAKKIDINYGDKDIQYFPNTPFIFYSYDISEKSTLSYSIGFIDGVYDQRIFESSDNDYEYTRGLLRFANQELLYNIKLGSHSIEIGAGKIDSVSTYNINKYTSYPDSYTYLNAGYEYLNRHVDLMIESKKYLKFNDESDRYSTWLDAYMNYSLKFLYPVKSKPYSLYLEGRGKLLSIRNGGIFVNEFPLICNDSPNRCFFEDDKILYRHFIDLAFGLEFENFILGYHTVTNNGNNFSWDNPYSDIGNNFTLPEYTIGNNNYSLFHYLKISWIFLD